MKLVGVYLIGAVLLLTACHTAAFAQHLDRRCYDTDDEQWCDYDCQSGEFIFQNGEDIWLNWTLENENDYYVSFEYEICWYDSCDNLVFCWESGGFNDYVPANDWGCWSHYLSDYPRCPGHWWVVVRMREWPEGGVPDEWYTLIEVDFTVDWDMPPQVVQITPIECGEAGTTVELTAQVCEAANYAWTWSDNGAGGSFSPPSGNAFNCCTGDCHEHTVQYTIPPGEPGDEITLTCTATNDEGTHSLSQSFVINHGPDVQEISGPTCMEAGSTVELCVDVCDTPFYWWTWNDAQDLGTFSTAEGSSDYDCDTGCHNECVLYTVPEDAAGQCTVLAFQATNHQNGDYAILEICVAPQTPVNAIATPVELCGEGSATLSASVPGAVIDWYIGGCDNGILIGTGNTLEVAVTETTTYCARARLPDSACQSVACDCVTVTVSEPSVGDMNCDCQVDFDDIAPFVTALAGESNWPYTDCPWINADCNGDGNVTFDDISPFVDLLSGSSDDMLYLDMASDPGFVVYEGTAPQGQWDAENQRYRVTTGAVRQQLYVPLDQPAHNFVCRVEYTIVERGYYIDFGLAEGVGGAGVVVGEEYMNHLYGGHLWHLIQPRARDESQTLWTIDLPDNQQEESTYVLYFSRVFGGDTTELTWALYNEDETELIASAATELSGFTEPLHYFFMDTGPDGSHSPGLVDFHHIEITEP